MIAILDQIHTSCLQMCNPRPVPPYFRACVLLAWEYLLNRVGIADSAKGRVNLCQMTFNQPEQI